MADVQHTEVTFTGRVQGVGFRYAAFQVAREFEVSGYVQNLEDGRVRVELEGTPEETEAYLDSLGKRMQGYIRKAERVTRPRAPQFSGFEIR